MDSKVDVDAVVGWICLALFAIAFGYGCAPVEYVKVTYVAVDGAELRRACPRLIGTYGGCVTFRGDIAEIHAPRPRDVRDRTALEVIGHEFYCHAWLKQSHTDEQGVRRDPHRDCMPEGT